MLTLKILDTDLRLYVKASTFLGVPPRGPQPASAASEDLAGEAIPFLFLSVCVFLEVVPNCSKGLASQLNAEFLGLSPTEPPSLSRPKEPSQAQVCQLRSFGWMWCAPTGDVSPLV